MTPLNELATRLRNSFPTALIDFSEPASRGGFGFLDIAFNGNTLAVQWQEKRDFGVSSPEGHGYGEAADEIYSTVDDAALRITDLLNSGGKTEPPPAVKLRELRAERKVTQMELAALLGVSQPAVSGFERRVDRMYISTLRTVIQAMGGCLVIQARFPDGVIRQIAIDEEETTSRLEPGALMTAQ